MWIRIDSGFSTNRQNDITMYANCYHFRFRWMGLRWDLFKWGILVALLSVVLIFEYSPLCYLKASRCCFSVVSAENSSDMCQLKTDLMHNEWHMISSFDCACHVELTSVIRIHDKRCAVQWLERYTIAVVGKLWRLHLMMASGNTHLTRTHERINCTKKPGEIPRTYR